MRVTLVRPPFMGKRFGPPIGLACLAGSLRARGHGVAVRDLNTLLDERLFDLSDYTRDFVLRPGHPALAHAAGRLDEFTEAILATDPEAVGFSLSYPTFDLGVALARRMPAGVRCIAGGPQATWHPEQLLALGCFHAVVPGYGEEAIHDALASDGIVARPLRPQQPYAPDYEGFELEAYEGRRSVITSRGCPNRCTFCTQHLRYLRHDLDAVVAQVRQARHAREIMFNDSNLNADEARITELFRRLGSLGPLPRSHVFGLQVRPGFADYVPLMARAGVREVRLGIESGSARERTSMQKPAFDNDRVVDMVRELTRHGIVTWTQFIFGYPDQDEGDRAETLALMERLNEVCGAPLVRHFWFRFMVHHGTEDLFARRYGVRATSPSRWENERYTPETLEGLAEAWRPRLPANASLYM